jgi:RecB family exonuclease
MGGGQESPLLLLAAAEVLSPSQVSKFLNCPAKWMFRYLLDLKEPDTAAQALGKAFHETIAYNFRQKQESSRDLPVAECLNFFRKALGEHLEESELQKGEHPMEFLELGETMVQKYLAEAAPLIQPAAVESRVSGVIGGVKVAGYVDLLDIDGRIVDSKTTLKPAVGIAHDHRFQLTSYVMITPAASGDCRLDTVTKGKTVRVIHKSFTITEQDRRYAERIYPMVQDSIRDGIFLPRRNSSLCSRRYCGFWRRCEQEFGGIVRIE